MTRLALLFLLLGSAIAIADPSPSSNEAADPAVTGEAGTLVWPRDANGQRSYVIRNALAAIHE
jgi:hypothetical protein